VVWCPVGSSAFQTPPKPRVCFTPSCSRWQTAWWDLESLRWVRCQPSVALLPRRGVGCARGFRQILPAPSAGWCRRFRAWVPEEGCTSDHAEAHGTGRVPGLRSFSRSCSTVWREWWPASVTHLNSAAASPQTLEISACLGWWMAMGAAAHLLFDGHARNRGSDQRNFN